MTTDAQGNVHDRGGRFTNKTRRDADVTLGDADEVERLQALVDEYEAAFAKLASTEMTHDDVYYAWEGIVRGAQGRLAEVIRENAEPVGDINWGMQLPKLDADADADNGDFLWKYAHAGALNVPLDDLAAYLRDRSRTIRARAAANPCCTSEQIDEALDDVELVAESAARNRSATPAQIERAASSPHAGVRYAAMSNPSASPQQIDAWLNSFDERIVRAAATNPGMPRSTVERVLSSPNVERRIALAANASLVSSDVDRLIRDPNIQVRQAAIYGPVITDDQLRYLVENDPELAEDAQISLRFRHT
jgi:hypothetical protein